MKILTSTLAASLLLIPTLWAQPLAGGKAGTRADRGQREGPPMRMMIGRHLGLTDDQKAEIKSVMQANREKAGTVRGDESLSPEQKRQAMQNLREANRAQMQSILTPEQLQKMEQMRERVRARKGGRNNCPATDGTPND